MKPGGLAECMIAHVGHRVEVIVYGPKDDPDSVTIECEDCCEVVVDGTLVDEES